MSGMLNPGSYTLCNRVLTTALTGEAQTAIDGLEGITGASIKFQFSYGSGGATVKVYVQVSLDGGETFMDVACFAFTTASATRVINLSGLTPVTTAVTPADGALADNTYVDGVMGAIWRVKVISTGTYVNSNILVSLEAR
jgi:hypothetical protein